jgi:hypothetical protein
MREPVAGPISGENTATDLPAQVWRLPFRRERRSSPDQRGREVPPSGSSATHPVILDHLTDADELTADELGPIAQSLAVAGSRWRVVVTLRVAI